EARRRAPSAVVMKRHVFAILTLLIAAPPAFAQETQAEADLRREREHIAEACTGLSPKAMAACMYALTTESPVHVALGSIAPQNGFAFGGALDEHYTPNEAWRITWNADGVATPSGSWRGGAYMKLIHTPASSGVVVVPTGTAPSSPTSIAPREVMVIDLFAQ